MKKFGSAISYLTVDLIKIWKNSNENNFAENRDKYLAVENPPDVCYYRQLDYSRMQKIVQFIDRYIDSITPENEMKMEIFFNQMEPAFIDDEVNTRLFNFSYADKVYAFARENKLSIKIHTIVWYRHIPKQLTDYLENRSAEDKKRLTFQFIKIYMQCLKERYPNAYSMELINEIAADPAEIRSLKEEGKPVYDFDDEGVRIDEWYKLMGKHYYIELFRMAREIFGDRIKLLYNDNNEGNREKQLTFKTVIDNIKDYEREHGVKLIDGFGMQCHFWGSEDEDKNFMEEMFQQCSRFGVELQITEFDVSNHSSKEIQQSIFNNFAEVAQKHGIEVFTTWGLNDIVSWLHGEEASLVDSNCDLKPFTMKYIKAFSQRYENANREKIEGCKMNAKLLGLFSGFPTHHFTDEIAEVLRDNLDERKSLVFISAFPDEYAQNDDDKDGMHQMFAEHGMGFAEHHVIDRRTSAEEAIKLVQEADCIWLMGGEVTWQMKLIQDLNLAPELLASQAVILGVSAGSMNMGPYVAEVWESKTMFKGLGLTDFIIKAHYEPDVWFLPELKKMSMIHPIIAMEDESAIFIKPDKIWRLGKMHKVDKGEITNLI